LPVEVSITHAAAGEEPSFMPTQNSTTAKATRSNAVAESDAIKLLKADHKEVKALFEDYEKLVKTGAGAEEKQALANEICTMLTVHATVEEELFYPAAREALPEDEHLLDEADVEHNCAKDLIAQIEESHPDEPLYDAKVKVLAEYIQHHVTEEEGELFPKVRKSDLDLDALGEALATRKAAMQNAL
jgi:hemerythrin superfamily protein